jgi:hypothetical protein
MANTVRLVLPWGWFLDPDGAESHKEIFQWWESRRLAFNVWVGLAGIITWFTVLIAESAAVKPGVDFEEPFAMILGPPLYAIIANICYTAGSIIDGIFYKRAPRPRLLQFGFWFSIFLTSLPGLWALYCWVRSVRTGQLLD